jgi:hypothetical protein
MITYNINLYDAYINVISDINNPTFKSSINRKNLILKNIISYIKKSNNITNEETNLDIIINKNILPSISTSSVSSDSIKLISSFATRNNSLALVRHQNLNINNEAKYPVMVLMDIDDSIQIIFYGEPVLYVKKTNHGYEVKELSSSDVITNKEEGVLYEIKNTNRYIFKYILGSLLFELDIFPPPKPCVCPKPAIPKQGISFGGNLNIPGHEETQAFRTSYQLINSLYTNSSKTEFSNAQKNRSQKPPPRNTFG